MKALALLSAILLVLLAQAARATEDFAAPTGLAVKEIRLLGAEPNRFFVVDVQWNGPAKPNCPGLQTDAYLEVRDVDAGQSFEIAQTHGDAPALFAPGYTGAFFHDARTVGNKLREGGNYEFRVRYHWRVLAMPPDIPEQIDVDTTTDPVSVTVTLDEPDPPPGAAPKDVIAVADAKKDRVTVTWKAGSAQDEGFAVLRAKVESGPGAKAGPKALGPFEEIARFAAEQGDVSKVYRLLDRSVEPDGEYEYKIALILDDQLKDTSPPDRAYTRADACPASDFLLWTGHWTLVEPAAHLEFNDPAGAVGLGVHTSEARCPFDSEIECETSFVGGGPKRFSTLPTFKVVGGTGVPADLNGNVPENTRGSLRVTMERSDRFDVEAFTLAKLEFRLVGTVAPIHAMASRDLTSMPPTTICGSIGVGKLRNDKGIAYARPGEPVVFVFQAVALGPAPLLAGSLQVQATLEGATFVEATVGGDGEFVRPIGNATGQTQALFEVGAIGPAKPRKSERVSIGLIAASESAPAQGQLRLRVKLLDVSGGKQVVKLPRPERIAEVRILGAPAAK